jgi:hypothetical protein
MYSVTIAGVDYPLRASMYAWQKWEEATGLKMNQLNESTSPIQVCQLCYFFAQAGLKREGKQMPMDLEAFMEELEMEDVEAISTAVGNAIAKTAQQKKRKAVRKTA